MAFDFQNLSDQRIIIDKLEVQSFEMNVYLVKLYVKDHQGMLYNGGKLMRFHSTQQIRDAFATMHVVEAVMMHESPYDEMIGNPPKVKEPMVLPFSMTQPY
ncbi:MAG: hypothetical protein Alis3KO_36640 [Aliiglaciecola sp.]|uniref:DUF6482 family protein n=1 Tax=Aliiglaciecola sp. M165 TaxID=2593649 RepID=UPI00117D3773|nr:DUF6482 family protein [Aliiglaciecola sp. M165]TRY33387.1 NADH-quinone reductase [Aliiglaciecola sp. M165]